MEKRQQIGKSVSKVWQNMMPEEKARILSNLKPSQKGHVCPESAKEKLRIANTGKKQSAETIAKRKPKLKVAMRGNKNGNKTVRCVETGIIYESVKSAALSVRVGRDR